jgi:hypothetical protein
MARVHEYAFTDFSGALLECRRERLARVGVDIADRGAGYDQPVEFCATA